MVKGRARLWRLICIDQMLNSMIKRWSQLSWLLWDLLGYSQNTRRLIRLNSMMLAIVNQWQSTLEVQSSIHIHRVVIICHNRVGCLLSGHDLNLVLSVRDLVWRGGMALLRLATLPKHMLLFDRRRLRCFKLVWLLQDKLVQALVVGHLVLIISSLPATFLQMLRDCSVGYGRLLWSWYRLITSMLLLRLVLKPACCRILLAQLLIKCQLVLSQRQLQIVLTHDNWLLLTAMCLFASDSCVWPGVARSALPHLGCWF